MTKPFLTIILFIFITSSFAQQRTKKDLAGKWVPVESDALGLDFVTNSVVNIAAGGKNIPVTYNANFSKSVIALEMLVPGKGEKRALKSEITFFDDNTIQWKILPGVLTSSFPGTLDASGAITLTLKRTVEIAANSIPRVTKTDGDLLGKWIFQLKPTHGMEFSKGNKLVLVESDDRIELDYKADFSKNPISLELVAEEAGQRMTIRGEIIFLNADTIKWRVFKDDLPVDNPGPLDKDGGVSSVLIRVK